MTEQGFTVAVAARALVTRDGGDRLLVSDDGARWYTPGGRLRVGESLKECAAREVYEETGLDVEVGDLVWVSEFWDEGLRQHKVECFFLATPKAGPPSEQWKDLDGPVAHMRFVAEEEWRACVHPAFLRQVGVGDRPGRDEVYRGFDRTPETRPQRPDLTPATRPDPSDQT